MPTISEYVAADSQVKPSSYSTTCFASKIAWLAYAVTRIASMGLYMEPSSAKLVKYEDGAFTT